MRHCMRHCSRIDVKSIVMNSKLTSKAADNDIQRKKQETPLQKTLKRKSDKVKMVIDDLYEKFNGDFPKPKKSDLAMTNFFFNKANIKFEWSAPTFNDIPGEKVRIALEKRQRSLRSKLEEDQEYIISKSLSPSEARIAHEPYADTEIHSGKMYPGKTEGIPFELINQLPEISFLGRCNSGKSTLLNSITTEMSRNSLNEYANASKRAGFTKTINCFNIGSRFRLIDTPGYGTKGTVEQGKVTMEYLQKRRELRRSFLLISANQGFSEFDAQMIDLLVSNGIPFEIVFNKMDTVKNFAEVESIIAESGVLDLPTSPRFIFVNSITNKHCRKRYGMDILRYVILEACGLSPGARPSKIKR